MAKLAANPTSLSDLLSKLATSLDGANSALPAPETAAPPPDGISLIDVKSELFLSYLQNLAFLILHKLRHDSSRSNTASSIAEPPRDNIVQKLIELRVYLEKGVAPLEGRLKYQIDKVIRAADAADQDIVRKAAARQPKAKRNGTAKTNGADDSHSSAASDAAESEDNSDDDDASIDELSYRPNPAAFQKSAQAAPAARAASNDTASANTGVYRPPRIAPTALPTTDRPDEGGTRGGPRPAQRSRAVDEYIAAELSSAPAAEPSIGSTIVAGGRTAKTARERREDAERTAYEEANFVRLPALTKKERARRGGAREAGFGGEELRGFGEDLGRVERVTGGASRKRRDQEGRAATADGPRGNGFGGGRGRPGKKRKFGK